MILSDHEIRRALNGGLEIDPFEPDNVQPASYDVRLGTEFRRFDTGFWPTKSQKFDPLEDDAGEITERETVGTVGTFVLEPGEFALATTRETVTLPDHMTANVNGRSSYGRCGLAVHITAGFIDPGFSGEITLELKNNNSVPLELTPGEEIGQLVFKRLSEPCSVPYGSERDSQYQGQTGAQPARLHEER